MPILKVEHKSNDVSFVIFGPKTWDLEGGGQIDPAQYILVFKYPSRDRVNINNDNQNQPFKKKALVV